MKTMKGAGLYLAQFVGDEAPFDTLDAIAGWAASLGYEGVQIPTWDARAVRPREGGDDRHLLRRGQGTAREPRPGDHRAVDASAGPARRRASGLSTRPSTASRRRRCAATRRRGRNGRSSSCSSRRRPRGASASTRTPPSPGALAWPFIYPWPQRPAGLVETAFEELARRWRPILDAFDEAGFDVCYEIHPGEDLHDGATFEMLPRPRSAATSAAAIIYDPSHFVLQQLDYLDFIDLYHERIKAFHVKDAEFNPDRRGRRLWRLSSPGSTGPAASARSATARSTSPASSRSSRNTATTAGPCWSGNAASSIQRTARAKARSSSAPHHPRDRDAPSTTSPPAAPTRRRTGACSASTGTESG